MWALRSRFDAEIGRLAIPALGALAAEPLVALVDTAFVGRLGPAELGGLAVAAVPFAWAFFAFNFLSYATTPLVAEAVGRDDRDGIARVVVTALVVAAAAGVAIAVLLEVLATPFVDLVGASADVRDPAITYLRIRALATPAVLLLLAGNGAFRGLQDTRTPLVVTVALSLMNLVLDPILIFGADMGVAGAAWASVAAQVSGAVAFVVLLRRRLALRRTDAPRVGEMGSFLVAGAQVGVRTAALLATLTGATAVAARIGTDAVAAHRVADQLWLFLALTVDALAVAAQAMVGRYRGRGETPTAVAVSERLLVLGLGVGLALALLMAALSGPLPRWFSNDAAVVDKVRSIYPFVVLMQPLNALVFVWDGVVLGAAAFRFTAVAMTGAAAVAIGVLLLVLPLGWGLAGVWWGIATLMAARLATMLWWHFRFRKSA